MNTTAPPPPPPPLPSRAFSNRESSQNPIKDCHLGCLLIGLWRHLITRMLILQYSSSAFLFLLKSQTHSTSSERETSSRSSPAGQLSEEWRRGADTGSDALGRGQGGEEGRCLWVRVLPASHHPPSPSSSLCDFEALLICHARTSRTRRSFRSRQSRDVKGQFLLRLVTSILV